MGLLSSLFGGSKSSRSSASTSQSSAYGRSFVDPMQQQFLGANYGSAFNNLVGQRSPGMMLSSQLARKQSGLLNAGAGLVGQSVGPAATLAQLGVLGQQLGQQFETGLNSIQNRFGMAGSIGSRAGVAGGQLLEGLGRNMALGTADILGQQSSLGLQGANMLGSLAGQTPGIFGTQFAPLSLYSSLIGQPTVLDMRRAQSQASSTSSGSGSQSGGIIPGLFGGGGFMSSGLKIF